jgi:predicted amidophosphoribosyltransferase
MEKNYICASCGSDLEENYCEKCFEPERYLWIAQYWNGDNDDWDCFTTDFKDYDKATAHFLKWFKEEWEYELDPDFVKLYQLSDVDGYKIILKKKYEEKV